MAESLCLNNVQTFWKMVRKLRSGNKTFSNMIDNVTSDEAISSPFAEKYEDVYNSVSYDDSEYSQLLDNLNMRLINSCCQKKECKSKHYISESDVSLALLKLRPGKTHCQLQSEHLKKRIGASIEPYI